MTTALPSSGLLGSALLAAACIGQAADFSPRQAGMAGGGYHSLALTKEGEFWSWGCNASGQLADGTRTPRWAPRQPDPENGLDIIAVAAGGDHTVVLTRQGQVWTCGANTHGQLGCPTDIASRPRLERVAGLEEVQTIAAGAKHTLALSSSGVVWAWGDGSLGQLGSGPARSLSPCVVSGLPPLASVATRSCHNLGLDRHGHVWAWGDNTHGQIGQTEGTEEARPTEIIGLPAMEITLVSASASSSYALGRDGSVWAWGGNEHGELADGSRTCRPLPQRVSGLPPIKIIACGAEHVVALTEDGQVYGWGDNGMGQLGDRIGGKIATPHKIYPRDEAAAASDQAKVAGVSCGEYHTFLTLDNGDVFALGHNYFGQLGSWGQADMRDLVPLYIQILHPHSPEPQYHHDVPVDQ